MTQVRSQDLASAKAAYNSFYSTKDFRQIAFAEKGMVRGILAKTEIPRGSVVMDLGCGTGKYARYFADEGMQVVALDLSEVGIRKARATAPQARLFVGDANHLPLRKESVDVLFSSGLSLLNEPDLTTLTPLVHSCTDCVRQNGFVVLVKTSKLTGRLAPSGSRFDHTVASMASMLREDDRLKIYSISCCVPHLYALRQAALTAAATAVSTLAAAVGIPSRICVIAQRAR